MGPDTQQTWVNQAIQAEVLDIALDVGYIDGLTLDKLLLIRQHEHWLVVFKAHVHGHRKVAYVSGTTFGETLELAAHFAHKGLLDWSVDRKRSKR